MRMAWTKSNQTNPAKGYRESLHDSQNAPFFLIEPLRRTTPLIFASPHSGRHYPKDMLKGVRLGLSSLRRGEDVYVDELFAGAAQHGAPILGALLARALVDLNRDPDELDPDMFSPDLFGTDLGNRFSQSARVRAGLGAIPKIAGDGGVIYESKLAWSEVEQRLDAYYAPYHETLASLMAETREAFGCAVLIDCHSMPSSAGPPGGPDIVLGDRYGASCHASVTALAEATLTRLGYQVARNAPFAGGYTTQMYGRPADGFHALQIELNRALYVNEATLERTAGFRRVQRDMNRLAGALAAAELHRTLA